MSFSSDVKDELSRQLSRARHCQIAEIAAAISFSGKLRTEAGKMILEIDTENVALARKYFTLIKKTFNINTDISIRNNNYLAKNKTYAISISEPEQVKKILQTIHMLTPEGQLMVGTELVNPIIVQNACCKRAFIRGAFLASGSMSDPEKSYHFEIVCGNEQKAMQLKEIVNSFDVDAKIVQRKKNYVVYLKEGAQIVDLLNIMEAHVALMNLENVRILKDMRNSVNRQVNCETANINKTVNAAVKQIEDIRYIQEHMGLDGLSPGLKEIALLRLDYPEAALKELGTYLDPPMGKSGVNHRLRKLSDIAEDMRKH